MLKLGGTKGRKCQQEAINCCFLKYGKLLMYFHWINCSLWSKIQVYSLDFKMGCFYIQHKGHSLTDFSWCTFLIHNKLPHFIIYRFSCFLSVLSMWFNTKRFTKCHVLFRHFLLSMAVSLCRENKDMPQNVFAKDQDSVEQTW